MTKAELIRAIQIGMGGEVTIGTAGKLVDVMGEVLARQLEKGESAPLPGIGTFSVATRKARSGRNPRTGTKISIPEKRVVKFTPGKSLKELIAE